MITACIWPHKSTIIPRMLCVEISFGPMAFVKSRMIFKGLYVLIEDERLLILVQYQNLKGHCEILLVHSHKSTEGNNHVFNVPVVNVEHYVHYLAQIIAGFVIHLVPNDRGGSKDPDRAIGVIARMVYAR